MEIYENLSIESLHNEEWRDVVGWEGFYQVSNLGRVKSLSRSIVYKDGREYTYPSKIIKNHFLIAKTNHQRFCLAAEIRYRKKATDCKITWFFWFKGFKISAYHYIFNYINFMKEIIAVWCRE